jgi:hypothetical protein
LACWRDSGRRAWGMSGCRTSHCCSCGCSAGSLPRAAAGSGSATGTRNQLAGDRFLEHRPGGRERERAGPQRMEVIAVPAERGLDHHVQPVGGQLAGQAQPPPPRSGAWLPLPRSPAPRNRPARRSGRHRRSGHHRVPRWAAGSMSRRPGSGRLLPTGRRPRWRGSRGSWPAARARAPSGALYIDVAQAPASLPCSQLRLVQGACLGDRLS